MKNTKLHRYALEILKSFGVDRDCYRTENFPEGAEKVLDELYTDGQTDEKIKKMFFETEFAPIAIVRELFVIGNAERTKKKDKYTLHWWTGDCDDGHEVGNNLKDAKEAVFDHLLEWMTQFGQGEGNETADDWDRMIYECGADIILTDKRDEDGDCIVAWSPSSYDEKRIGWVHTEDMTDENYNAYAKVYGWKKRKVKK